jgi:hypothetical protein
MYYYDPTGNGGKRFGVRLSGEVSAWVFEHASATQANCQSDSVSVSDDAVVVYYRDASLGIPEVGTIAAYAHVNGDDTQVDLPVVLVR